MNKYMVIWYGGQLGKIYEILNYFVVEAESIKDVEWISVLDEKEPRERFYRYILTKPNEVDVDYGSWSRFVKIREVYNYG